jgi:type IV pilus assembly protein PilW
MSLRNQPSKFHQTGFSLVEILVGLVIGLLATLVIMQVFSVFEGQKRTTTGTSDAQTNGGIALYSLVRDLAMAGYGLAPIGTAGVADSAIECTTLTVDPATGLAANTLSPVIVTDGGGGVSDSITLHIATTASGGLPTQLTLPLAAGTSVVANVANNLNCLGNNTTLTINSGSCAITTSTADAGNTLAVTLNQAVATPAGAYLACLGDWQTITYAVNANNLERNNAPSVADIVNIQAQYGIAAAGLASTDSKFNQIIQWVDATGAWAAPATVDRNRIKAVRVAVVARNGLLEKNTVSKTCGSTTVNATPVCSWPDEQVNPLIAGSIASAAPAIDLSNIPNWQQYRYRVFETIIPLRSVIWAKDTL